ncbi:MAG: OmpH family outer membrane protein [Candidatus Omnitrophica bacterium]|nr:OmpH family outer membrane protein [Candidatus Omnitrophota bacterium]
MKSQGFKLRANGYLLVSFFLLAFLFDHSPVFAADQPVSVQRIGVVNLDRILQDYKRTKVSDQKLGEIYKSKQAEREKLVAEIKSMKEELVLLNEQSRQERQQAMDQKLKNLSEFDKASVEFLQKERERAINEILKEVEEAVSSYAKEKGFDLILSSRAVLYELQAMDLTDEVLQVLNDRYGKKGGS